MSSWTKSSAAGIFQQRFFVPLSLAQRARIALAAGSYDRAAQDIAALERGHGEWAKGLGRVLRASLLAARGQDVECRLALEQGEREVTTWEVGLYVLAARWRLGGVVGDPQMTRRARDAMEQLGIRNPERMVDTLLPWPATRTTRTDS